MMRLFTRAGLGLSLSFALAGCASTQEGAGDEDVSQIALDEGQTLSRLSFKATAEGNWEAGEAAFKDEEYLEAERYYRYVRNKFPYSRYALMADLRIADSMFYRERYREAIDAYQSFSRMHPTHPKIPYAMYMIAKSYEEKIPSDWFALPPSYERDRADVHDAVRSYQALLRRYPDYKDAAQAQKSLDTLRQRLVAHERYVANFYKRDEHWPGYAGRLETIREDYGDVALTDALLLELAEVYAKMERWEAMFEALDTLKAKFPDSKLNEKADQLIAKLPKNKRPAPKKEEPAPQAQAPAQTQPAAAPSPQGPQPPPSSVAP